MQRVNSVITPEREQSSKFGDGKRNAIGDWIKPKWLWLLVGAGALVLLAGVSGVSRSLVPVTCKVDQPIARGTDAIIKMTVRSGGACTVAIRSAALAMSTLELQTLPKNGVLRRRGNTGVSYWVGQDFKGRDSFSFSIAREPSGQVGTVTYHVDVNVL